MAYSPNSKNIHMAVADEEFLCPLCCEVFEEPKLLPNCAHSYCKSCLRDLVLRNNSTRVSCPVCRKVSSVPQNGVEGFATNTLLVRLIDNIPGRKDKELVSKALAKCKEEIEKNKTIQEEMEKKFSKINQNREKGLMLKREISKHAQNAIDSIRQWEQNLCSEVDSYLEEKCGLEFHGKLKFEELEEQKQKWKNQLGEAAACVKTVEEMLDRNRMEEILEMKEVVLEQLHEYSSFPSCLSNSKPIQEFDREFQKCEVKQDLGKVLKSSEKTTPPSTASCGFSSAAPLFSGALPSNSDSSSYSDTSSDEGASGGELLHVGLRFCPYRLAVCDRTGDIALLWEDKRQVHLFSRDGEHKRTISIKYGDLYDVGFTIDDEIVVVNRQHNRLLLYEKDGQFINFEVETPRDCLKYTYVSVDLDGRLIITSTQFNYDDSDTVIPCIIVYNNDCSESCKMFGRRVLVRPISRAIYQNGQFYITDECDDEIFIRCFTFQGKHFSNIRVAYINPLNQYPNISLMASCNKVFVMRSTYRHETFVTIIQDGKIVEEKKQNNSHFVTNAAVIDQLSNGSIIQAESYEDQNMFAIIKYY